MSTKPNITVPEEQNPVTEPIPAPEPIEPENHDHLWIDLGGEG